MSIFSRRAVSVLALFVLTCSTASAALAAEKPSKQDEAIIAEVDQMLAAAFKPDQPGAAVIVVREGRVVFRKGYGLANLELGAPMRPEMVFEIGSVTKQFTATAILMLAEQGKLSLDEDIRTYLPDYPDKGAK